MARFYDFVSKLSGCLAGVCAILAVLAAPSPALADDTACPTCCGTLYTVGTYQYQQCVTECQQGFGPCANADQCPNKFDDQGKFIGCQNPGAVCYVGGTAGTCGLSLNGSNCTCNI